MIILIVVIAGSYAYSNTNHENRSYTIPEATVDLYVQPNGSLEVTETLHYSFKGTYRGINRNIPLKSGEKIENVNVSTNGAYSFLSVTNNSTSMEYITVYLTSDELGTEPITDRDVDVILTYEVINATTIYNDIAEVHYIVWGEYWDVPVGQLTTNVHVPSQNGVKYWLNPPYYVKSDNWQGSVLNVVTGNISPGNFFEVRLAIPKDEFTNPVNARQVNITALPEIEAIQQDYQGQINFYSTLYYTLSILLLLSLLVPVCIYYKYGREPKPTYQGEYERDPPTDDPPAMVSAISGKGIHKNVGTPGMDGFQATIMDLINRGYITTEVREGKKGKKTIDLKLKSGMHSELDFFELDVMRFLKHNSTLGVVNLDKMKKNLKKKENAKEFQEIYNKWQYHLEKQYLSESTMKNYFIKSGDNYLKIYGGAGIIVTIVILYFTYGDPLPAASLAFIVGIIIAIASIICLVMPPKIGGRWTQHGVDYDAKWQAFKKYLKDFSLIKEYPPESVTVWNQYLVYATALGVADEVRDNMKLTLPQEELDESYVYSFHYYGGYTALASSLHTGMSTDTSEGQGGFGGGSGGVGGVGGGSGGGGGGAF